MAPRITNKDAAHTPRYVVWELTLKCDLACRHCGSRAGRVRQDELTLDGRILTAVRTDPGWAPLFVTCSGILIERGSTLSHSAVIARELGIPAVVGVSNLLAIVDDDERARLDGGRGTIERLDLPIPTDPIPGDPSDD